jgi:hypothetical protein
MKRLLIAIPLLMCVAFADCKKAKGPANGKSVQPNDKLDSLVSMSAIINGNFWQTDSVFGYYIKSSGNDTSTTNLFVTATVNGAVPSTITFNITNYTGLKTYTVNPPVVTIIYYVGNTRYMATHGQIIVTSDSEYGVIGTFNFIADIINASGGEFNVAHP